MAIASCRAFHSASDRSRYFSVTISRTGPTFWAIPPWTSTKLSQICCARLRRHLVLAVDVMIGQQPAAADAELGIAGPATQPSMIFMPGQMPPESCQPPPDPPNHSPRMARAATSFRSGS